MVILRRTILAFCSVAILCGVLLSANATALSLSCPTVNSNTPIPDDSIDVTIGDFQCGSPQADLKKLLLDNGFSNNAAAGILGNINNESGFVINKVEGGALVGADFVAYDFVTDRRSSKLIDSRGNNIGFGLAQWTSDGRLKNLQNYADSIGKPVVSMEAQGGFLIKELASRNGLTPSRLNSMSAEEVTWVMMRDFETPLTVFCVGSQCGENRRQNQQSARSVSLSTLVNNQNLYDAAFHAYDSRRQAASSFVSLDVSNCSGGATDDEGDDAPDPTPIGGQDPDTDDTPPSSTGSDTGAIGRQNVNNLVGQFDNAVKDVTWRTDGSTIGASGCSLVSVVNAARVLGYPAEQVNVSNLASWSKRNISSANWDNLKRMAKHVGLSTSSWLWQSKSTSADEKIRQIRATLASGGVVIAGGDHGGAVDCNNSGNKSSGKCVFSRNGHFVAIIGITADNKLVVANPANANNRTWIFPAANALMYSNKAIMVK